METWEQLFETALTCLDTFPQWTFGGGTAPKLQVHHRESHDIDLFLEGPQLVARIANAPLLQLPSRRQSGSARRSPATARRSVLREGAEVGAWARTMAV